MCPARWVFSNVMFCVRVFMAIACVSHILALEGHAMAPEFKPEPSGKHPVKGFPSFPSTVLLMIFTHESSGAISNSGFPMSSLNMQVFFCFHNLHELRHLDQIVYFARSQHVIHLCAKLWHVCCAVVLPLSKSSSRTEHCAKMHNT